MKILDLNNLSTKHAKLLDHISRTLIDDFHKLIEEIYSHTDGKIDWLVNSLLSRHNYLSGIYLDLCYVELVKEISRNEIVDVLVCKTYAQGKVINEYFSSISKEIKIIHSGTARHNIIELIKPIRHFLKNVRTSIIFLINKKKERKNIILNMNDLILIDMFFIPSMFSSGVYNNRYYPGISEHIPLNERKKLFYVPNIQINYKLGKVLKISDAASDQFLYKLDFLTIYDYLFSLLSPFRIKKINLNSFSFKDVKIGAILKQDFIKNIANPSSFSAILNYLFFKRLKQYNVSLKYVINWFENQVIDRGFNKGKNVYFPSVPSLGYQGFITSYDFEFQLQPTQLEYKLGVLPQKIAVVGKKLKKCVKKYCSSIKVVEAPAFRMANVYNDIQLRKNDILEKVILVILPISIKYSMDILELLFEFLNKQNNQNIEWMIKPHPSSNIKKINKHIEKSKFQIKIVNSNLLNLFEKTDLVVGNTSSVLTESIAYGIPVIIIGSRNSLTQNPIPESVSDKIWSLCYNVEEFNVSLNRFLTSSTDKVKKERVKIGKQIRADFFEPVTEEGVCQFLNLI